VLSTRYLSPGGDGEVGKLLKEHEEDGSAIWLYTWALWTYRQGGDSPESRRRLKEALKENPHVPDYLLGRKRLPRDLPDLIGFGDEEEAIAYAADTLVNWRNTPGALEWLATRSAEGQPGKGRAV
jgi:hypothetical protein